jgi:hypothetical protein
MAMVTVGLLRVEGGANARRRILRRISGELKPIGNLLGKQISAVGDAPVERHRGKI